MRGLILLLALASCGTPPTAPRTAAQLREDTRLDTPPAEHDSPPEHYQCALTPVEHRWTILGVTYTEIVEEC